MAKGRSGRMFVPVAAESEASATVDGDTLASTPRSGGWLGQSLTGGLTRDLLAEAERPVVVRPTVSR